VQYQYFANVRAGAGGVRKVFVFLGEDGTVETESVRWVNRPGFVGYTGFQNSEVKENMTATDVEMQMNSVVALTSTLEEKMEMGELLSFDEVAVGAYLQDKLTWRLVGVSFLMLFSFSISCKDFADMPSRPTTNQSHLKMHTTLRLKSLGRRLYQPQ
jgi:hypothetical protein